MNDRPQHPPILARPPGSQEQPRERKKPGPKPKVKAALDEFDVAKLRGADACPGCGLVATPMGLAIVKEMVVATREQFLNATAEVKPLIAEINMLQLAARLEGYCSLSCWRTHKGGLNQ